MEGLSFFIFHKKGLKNLSPSNNDKLTRFQSLFQKSLGGDRAFAVQFLEQRVTDIENKARQDKYLARIAQLGRFNGVSPDK